MTLNLTGLRLEDAIEILYDCRGDLTTLEIFNLKDDSAGERPDDSVINSLRHALNSGNVVKLKNLIRLAMERVKAGGARDRAGAGSNGSHILRDMSNFLTFYARTPLTVSIGQRFGEPSVAAGARDGDGGRRYADNTGAADDRAEAFAGTFAASGSFRGL